MNEHEEDHGLVNELIDAPPLLTEQEAGPEMDEDTAFMASIVGEVITKVLAEEAAGPEMVCPVCIELGDARDSETGEYLADDCGACGGTGWLPEEGYR